MMKKIALLCLLGCRLLPAMAQHADAVYPGQARFATGDDAQWAAPGFDDSGWKTIVPGKVWQEQGFADYHGFAWYRMHVVIPSSLKKQAFWKDSLRIFLAHVNDVDETFLNGKRIGKTGSFPADAGGYASKWPAVREYHVAINDPAIRWDEENVLAVRDYDGGGTGGIFMGLPYIDVLEKTDGIQLQLPQNNIQYTAAAAKMPLALNNLFNTAIHGRLQYRVYDALQQKELLHQNTALQLGPFEQKTYPINFPNRPGIEVEARFTQDSTSFSVEQRIAVPYLLTPPAPAAPRINNAPVFGVRPGSPFLFAIAATGQRPLQYAATGLPEGLTLDKTTGIITGTIKNSGTYQLRFTVTNQLGKAQQSFTIHAGAQLALTPVMGWNSWNCWGVNVSEEKVKSSAGALISKGLADHGWNYINIDDGWESPVRAADSSVVPNRKFPDMKGLGNWLHARALKFGIYSSPGPLTCGGYLGSYRNEQKDAATYAAWGIDYLKYDWCSYDQVAGADTSRDTYVKPYRIMQQALRQQQRDIVYSLCQYGMKDVWKWGATVDAQSWRTTEDIEDTWASLYQIGFHQQALYSYAKPGNWNDPDMMIVGQVGWGENLHPSRLTPDEQYTHVSLWCLLSAPLLIGCDLAKLDAFTLNLLTNDEVLAVDQDVLGKQAQRIINEPACQVWMKPLADGSRAIGIFNMDTSYRKVNVQWNQLGLTGKEPARDLWRQHDAGLLMQQNNTVLPPHGVLLLKVKPKNKI